MSEKRIAAGSALGLGLLAACLVAPSAVAHPVPQSPGPGVQEPVPAGSTSVFAAGMVRSPGVVEVPWFGALAHDGPSVRVGEFVVAGQPLLRLDDQAAQAQLDRAQATVRTAQDRLAVAQQDITDEQVRLDRARVTFARLAYRKAKVELYVAERRAAWDGPAEAALVDVARHKLRANEHDESYSRTAVDGTNRSTNTSRSTNTFTPPTPPTSITSNNVSRNVNHNLYDGSQFTENTSRSGVAGAIYDLAQAEHARGATVLDDWARIHLLRAEVRRAGQEARVAELDADFNERGAVVVARTALDHARLQVHEAQAALDATVIRAPRGGVVVSIVGHPSGSTVAGSGAAALLGAGLLHVSSADPSGVVVLADPARTVTARLDGYAAQAVWSGQPAQVSFRETGTVVPGTVSTIDTDVRSDEVRIELTIPPGGSPIGRSGLVRFLTGRPPQRPGDVQAADR